MAERLAADIAAALRATGTRLGAEAADKLDGLISLLAQAETDRDAALAKVAGYEAATVWDTTCTGCAVQLDAAYRQTVRAETAETALRRVRDRVAAMAEPGASFFDPYAAMVLTHDLAAIDGTDPPDVVPAIEVAEEARRRYDDALAAIGRVRALHSPEPGWEREWCDPAEALREGLPSCAGCLHPGISFRRLIDCRTLKVLDAPNCCRS